MNTCSPLEGESPSTKPSEHKRLYCIFYDTLGDKNPFSSAYNPQQAALSDISLSIAAEVVRLILALLKNPPTVFSP